MFEMLYPIQPHHIITVEIFGKSLRRVDGRELKSLDELNARRVADAEDLDVNAQIHGNWTVENAKSRLHQFLQMNKINADYKYSAVGPDHQRFTIVHSSSCQPEMFSRVNAFLCSLWKMFLATCYLHILRF